jgi:hypothetical protein
MKHGYLKNSVVPVSNTYRTWILQGCFCLCVPGVSNFFKKKSGCLQDTAQKKDLKISNTYLLFTLLDLGLYSKDHLMTMEVLYYP